MAKRSCRRTCLLICSVIFASSVTAADKDAPLTEAEASAALERAARFFREEVSASGGYLWRYSADLKSQEGETSAKSTTAWVQPPGTPSVGSALLRVYELTGEDQYLDAVRETARALVRGQLQSGGWDYRIEFAPQDRRRYAYRVDGNSEGRNVTTLDDDTTQAAVRFLMAADQALEFKDPAVHEAVEYALNSLMKAQYPNGAWPQRFSAPPDREQFPVRRASLPASWSREYVKSDYAGHYTLNDNTLVDMIETMLDAADLYGDDRYRQAALQGGEFLLRAQLPEPHPAWAQQYNVDMHPVWARKFEPPAITGGESQGALQTLLMLYRRSGERRFLEPVPRAVAYLKKLRLADGRLARFYELGTDRPLYFTTKYELTDRDDDLPTHYGFKVGSKLDRIEAEYRRLLATEPEKLNPPPKPRTPRMSKNLAAAARRVVDALDERGAWVEDGRLKDSSAGDKVIDARTFARNVEVLAEFIAAARAR